MRRIQIIADIENKYTCNSCGKNFLPKRKSNPNKFCSISCGLKGNKRWEKRNPDHPNSLKRYEELREESKGEKNYFSGMSRELSPNWKGGRFVDSRGYIIITRYQKKNIPEHRMVMESFLGRELKTSEHIHHIDGDRKNNKIENLELLTSGQHMSLHAKKRKRKRGRFISG